MKRKGLPSASRRKAREADPSPPRLPGAPERTDRWQHLVTGAFHLDEANRDRSTEQALQYLRSVLEVFPGVDPVEDFEGYAVRRMAGSLARALEAASKR